MKFPIVWSWAQAECLTCDFTVLSAAFGGAMFDKDGNPTLTSAGTKKALDYMVASLKDGLTNPSSLELTEGDVDSAFIKGDAAFALNWTFQFAEGQDASKSSVVGQVGIALIPGSGSVRSATVNGGQPLSISAGSKHAAEAWQYILYMSSKDFQKKYPKNALPIWKSLYDDPSVVATAHEVVKIAKDQYSYLVNRPVVPFYSEFSTDLQVRIQECLQGKKASDQALKEVQAKALELAARK